MSEFETWYRGLRDMTARARIAARLTRFLQGGNLGDHRERILGSVCELRIDHGPGYRVYYVPLGVGAIVLLGGATKDMQDADILRAVQRWEEARDDVEGRTADFGS